MKKVNFSKIFMMLALPLLAFGLDSCKDPDPIVRPDIQIKGETGDFGETATLEFAPEGGTKTITLTSTGAWTARESTIPAWITTFNPQSGNSGERTISITVGANTETTSRSAEIEFYINDYTSLSAKLTVRQTAEGEPTQDDVLLLEEFGVTPLPGDNPPVADYANYFSRLSPAGLDQSGVTYTSNGGSIRTSAPPNSSEFSGVPLLYLASNMEFVAQNIDIDGNTQLIVRMGAGVFDTYGTMLNPVSPRLQLFAGWDGTSWAELNYTTAIDQAKDWYWINAEFAVPQGTDNLYVRIVNTYTQARFDDFQVIKGGNGALIEPGAGPELTETTIPELNARMSPTAQPTGDYFIKAIVTTNMADGNFSNGNLSIMTENATAEWNGIMLRNSGTNFFGTKDAPLFLPGEEIEVDLSGTTLQQYRGTSAQEGDPYVNQVLITDINAITKTGRTVTVNPVTIAYDKIVEYQNMVVQIESAQSANAALTTWPTGNTTTPFTINDNSAMEFNVFTATNSNIVGQTFLTGNGTIKGIAYVYGGNNSGARSAAQLTPRTYDDVSGLTGTRVGTSKYFEVSPIDTPVNVSAASGTKSFTVTSNVVWTVTSSNASVFALDTNGGDSNATVTVTYGANESTTDGRSTVITFATADTDIPAADRTVAITINQEPASATGGGTDDFATLGNTATNYGARETVAGWTAVYAAVLSGNAQGANSSPKFAFISADESVRALCINGRTDQVGIITSPTLTGGIGTLSFDYGMPFANDPNVGLKIEIKQGGSTVKEFTISRTDAVQVTKYTFSDTANIAGEFTIVITNTSPSNSTGNRDRTAIWNVVWTGYPN